jgi:hypothetical protein
MIIVDCLDGNPIFGCLDVQNISKWNVFKPKYWNYTFGLINSFLEDNKCIVFIQGVDTNFVGQVRVCAEGSFGFDLKKKYYCINSIPSSTPNPKK